MLATVAVSLGVVTASPAFAEPQVPVPPAAAAAPSGTVAGAVAPAVQTPTSAPVSTARMESWTPTSHSVTVDGQTTLDLFAQPAFKRSADGWSSIDSTITAGTGDYPFEALGLANPVHFGLTADALMTIDTVNGSVVFGLPGATINTPTLTDGVVTYAGVFPGVDLEFRTDGGRIGKHFVLADAQAKSDFRFTITDPGHTLGTPIEGAGESWTFSAAVAYATGIELPAPAAWTQADQGPGLPGSAHQNVSVTGGGYAIDLSVDPLWAETASYPLVLDPAVQWTDETWTDNNGLSVAFGPTGATDCAGSPCQLADPVDGGIKVGSIRDAIPVGGGQITYTSYLAYVGADVSALAGRQVTSAVIGSYEYWTSLAVKALCSPIGTDSTGADLAAARCGDFKSPVEGSWWHGSDTGWDNWNWHWAADVTADVRAAVKGDGPTGSIAGFAIDAGYMGKDANGNDIWIQGGNGVDVPELRLVYTGYPVPRPLTADQTFGCDCWAGHSSGNQAMAADPVNTATGALMEQFGDVSVAGVGQSISLSRTYNSLDTASGPFGPSWSYAYGASLVENASGEFVFTDGSGTRTRFGALVGGGYAPIDPAVSATLTDGPDGTRVMRNLSGNTMTFDASGALIAAADERGQGLTFAYTGGALTTITDALGQTLTFGWDGTGADARIVSATTSDGRAVGYAYTDTAGAKRLTGVTAVDGTTTTYAYATTGGLSSITDPLGHVSARNTYNKAGRIVSQRDQTGAKTTFAWDAATQTATVTDPTGKVRTDVYNGLNLVKQIDGNGAVVEQLYDGDNNAAATVDAANRLYRSEYDDRDRLVLRVAPAPLYYAESWTYDDADRVTSHTDADGYTTSYTYDAAGLVTSVNNPDGGTNTYTYTTGSEGAPANLLASSTDALGRTTTFTYDTAGDLVSTTTPGGQTTTSTYDATHRRTSTTSPSGAVTSYTYDAAGRMLTVTDPTGAVTTNTYDAAGRLTATADALGRTTRFFYDRSDRLIRTRDAAGNNTRTSYDGAGRVETTTDALGAVTTYAYDDAGRLISTTDALGRVTTMAYDALGQLTSTTDPTGGVTSYTYDVVGQRTSVTDPDGVTQTTTYDRRGHVAAVTNAAGGFQQTYYDSMGRPSQTTDSDGVYTNYTYDLAGQLVVQAKARSTSDYIAGYDEDRTTYAYDADGHTTSTVDPRGSVPGADPAAFTTTVTYDADGRPVTSTDPLGRTVTTEYDADGRPVTVTDPAGNVTTTSYNAVGWTTSVRAPGEGRTHYRYDRVGNLTKRIDPLGSETTYTYDAAGRVLTQTDPLGRVTSTSYDAVGNVAQVVKPSGTQTVDDPTDGTVSYTYDAANRPVATTFSDDTAGFTYDYSAAGRLLTAARVQNGGVSASSAYTYDGAGRKTSVVRTGPGGGDANYSYTSAGRLSGAAWSTGMQVAYSYNQAGELTAVAPSGTGSVPAVNYGYDPSGRVSTVTRQGSTPVTTAAVYDAAGQLASLSHATAAGVLEAYGITRDTRGNPTQVDTTTASGTTSALYTYDAVSRLRSECYPATGDVCTGKSPRNAYTYDLVGNRATETSRTVVGTKATTVSTVSTDYAYDAADELLTKSVDGTATVTNTWSANGALATSTTPTGTQTYVTDLTDELVSYTPFENGPTVGYTQDAQGNRTSRTVDGLLDATWAWDDLSSLPMRIGEYDPAGTLTTGWLPDPTSSTGASLAQTSGSVSSWLLSDPFANTVATVSTIGNTVSGTRTMDAFGVQRTTATGSLADASSGFAGQYLDGATGLYDMRARDYDPASGRFTATDPVAVPTGMPYVAGYSYSYNNPLMFSDPSGMLPGCNGLFSWVWGLANMSCGSNKGANDAGKVTGGFDEKSKEMATSAAAGAVMMSTPGGQAQIAGGYASSVQQDGWLKGTLKASGAYDLANDAYMTPMYLYQGDYWDAGRSAANPTWTGVLTYDSAMLGAMDIAAGALGPLEAAGCTARTEAGAAPSVARFVASADGTIIDTQSSALFQQIENVVKSLRTTKKPPPGVYQGGYKNQKGVYANLGGDLPPKPLGYYTESAVWPGAPGTERIVVGQKPGEVWYSPDHYGTFRSWP
ncbi:RHS repeat-associated core domain-containing protein [Demequina lutea]|uniref:RHS repeat-associated protein n=1 Tax=Demequina lutea TaxID=431489 RepID=A0A7Y9ZDB7_9MICO|nr:RHS repeat-associated core domain-containing protein [Demequina lutea]NYI41875.1 RHS repeat-associated protein [Demequina lutea]